MEKSPLNIKFFLRESSRTLSRNYSKSTRVPGTRGLECYITFGKRKLEALPNGMYWKPEGKYSGSANMGWKGMAMTNEEKSKILNVKNRLGKLRINASGELIEYLTIKFPSGLYILPEAWNSKEQVATSPYEAYNSELKKLRHIIKITYTELIQRKDFDKGSFLAAIKDRIKNGVPLTVVIPDSSSTVQTIKQVAKALANAEGGDIPSESNPNNVPDDMRDYIPWYAVNRLSTIKLSDDTIKSRQELADKLQRYYDQTGKSLSLTKSKISDVSDFFKWRMYDNEQRKARKGINDLVNGTTGEAVGIGTLNKTKKLTQMFFDNAKNEFDVVIALNENHASFKEQPYDREMNDAYLNMDQLFEIFKLDLRHDARLNRHRSLFILGSLGGGYRVRDLIKLPVPSLEKFDDGKEYYCFDVISDKTNTRTKVPIPPQLNMLIEEYDFTTEVKPHDFRDDIKIFGQMCNWNQQFTTREELSNGEIKIKSEPFWKKLMPRTCRKSFCSLLYNFYDMTIQECCAFSGHNPNSDEFLKYLNIDKKVKAQKLVKMFAAKPIFQQ